MEPRGLMGGFYRISEWIMRFSAINLLWLICSLPFVAVALLLLAPVDLPEEQIVDNMKFIFMLLAVIAPFTLFPATAAMFTVARKWVMGESDVSLFKTFFRGYKENYKQSMIRGIIYVLLIVVMVVDFIFFKEKANILAYVFIAFLVLVILSLFNYFSMLSHYHMKTLQLVKNAVLITIGKPLRSLSTAIMCGFVVYISFFHFQFLIPFFMGSVVAYLAFWNFNIIYVKLQEQAERMKQQEEEEAEIAAEMDREDLVKDDYKEEQEGKK